MAEAHAKQHDYHLVNPIPWPAVGATGAFTLQGLLTNNGTVTIAGGGQLTAATGITNNLTWTGTVSNAGMLSVPGDHAVSP